MAWATGRLAAKYEYDPYGNIVGPDADGDGNIAEEAGPYAATNPFRFSTKFLDAETGLYYYGYRYYSPRLGRWISRDPITEHGARIVARASVRVSIVFSAAGRDTTLYLFVGNDPARDIDILGLTTYATCRECFAYCAAFYEYCKTCDKKSMGCQDNLLPCMMNCSQKRNSGRHAPSNPIVLGECKGIRPPPNVLPGAGAGAGAGAGIPQKPPWLDGVIAALSTQCPGSEFVGALDLTPDLLTIAICARFKSHLQANGGALTDCDGYGFYLGIICAEKSKR
ncbi:MAG: hypothetical protein IPM64_13155 [Phycisphaerales bacterium]|nr:hypothetical protein [Phycisphaerales bacterium]